MFSGVDFLFSKERAWSLLVSYPTEYQMHLTVGLHVVTNHLAILLLLLQLNREVADLGDEVGESGDHLWHQVVIARRLAHHTRPATLCELGNGEGSRNFSAVLLKLGLHSRLGRREKATSLAARASVGSEQPPGSEESPGNHFKF